MLARALPGMACLLVLSACAAGSPTWPLAEGGVIDLRAWETRSEGIVRLDGEWRYYPLRLLEPGDPQLSAPLPQVAGIPGNWGESAHAPGEPAGHGYATYALTVRLPRALDRLALRFITTSSAFRCWADGREVASAGHVADNAAQARSDYHPQTVTIDAPPDGRLEIVLQVSNFDHVRGGPWESIWIGTPESIRAVREGRIAVALFLAGSFCVIGLYHLIVWLTRREERSPLYFAVVCFAMAIRGLTVDEIYFSELARSLSWTARVRTEYVSLLVIVVAMAPFLREIFPREEPLWLSRAYSWTGLVGTLLVLVLAPETFTGALPLVQLYCLSAAAVGVVILVVAVIRGREGGTLFLLSVVAVLVTGAHDVLISVYRDLPPWPWFGTTIYLQPFGHFVFVLSQAAMLAMRSSRAVNDFESTQEELREAHTALDAHAHELEERVADRTAELEAANRALARLAEIDGLTRVGNRRFFEEELRRSWTDHHRRAASLALLLVDVDHFKAYNDRYGHLAGDVALQRVAATVASAAARPGDSAARYGGEELVALLPNTDLDGARRVAERLRQRVEAAHIPHDASPAAAWVTVSIGVASLTPREGMARTELVERADRALYRAKERGRNRVATG